MRNKMMLVLLIIMTMVILTGCQSNPRFDDGYDFGDVTLTGADKVVEVVRLRHLYCSEQDPLIRAVLLASIRSIVPDYPERGICTSLLERLDLEGYDE